MPSELSPGLRTDPAFAERLHSHLNRRRVWQTALAPGSVLGAFLHAVAQEFAALGDYCRLLVAQIYFDLAEGTFLDAHGATYGFPRAQNESDAAYRARILTEITQERVTRAAIVRVLDASGLAYQVYDSVHDTVFFADQYPASGAYLVWVHLLSQDIGGFFDMNFCDDDPSGFPEPFYLGPMDSGKYASLRTALDRVRAAGIDVVLQRVTSLT
jgi:hypothetical protein